MSGARDRKRSADGGNPFAYPGHAEAGGLRRADHVAAAIVLDSNQQRIFAAAAPLDPQQYLARRAVAQRVGQAVLRDAIGGAGDETANVGEIAPAGRAVSPAVSHCVIANCRRG